MQGKIGEALAAAQKESDEASKFQAPVCIYRGMGRCAESDEALRALKQRFAVRNAYMIAAAHAYLGKADAAFVWLDLAYQQRKGSLVALTWDPLIRNLRGEPRYMALLVKLKLTDS